MQAPVKLELNGESCWISPGRCIYLEKLKTLVLSDLHFGKTGHFRKSGIAIPQQIYLDDLHRLMEQVQHFKPEVILFTGDLFHSDENREHELFERWRKSISQVSLLLVKGNHDRLAEDLYSSIGLTVYESYHNIGAFGFLHDIEQDIPEVAGTYVFCGHIHPGIRINGLGKQSLSFPCYQIKPTYAVLPAFSRFTGLKLVDRDQHDRIFAIIPTVTGRPTLMEL